MTNEDIYKNLNFSEEELRALYKNFKALDTDKSGKLESEEFFDIPELANNPLVKRVIDVMDKNKDGSISFLEFVLNCFEVYCTLSSFALNESYDFFQE